MDYLRTRVFML